MATYQLSEEGLVVQVPTREPDDLSSSSLIQGGCFFARKTPTSTTPCRFARGGERVRRRDPGHSRPTRGGGGVHDHDNRRGADHHSRTDNDDRNTHHDACGTNNHGRTDNDAAARNDHHSRTDNDDRSSGLPGHRRRGRDSGEAGRHRLAVAHRHGDAVRGRGRRPGGRGRRVLGLPARCAGHRTQRLPSQPRGDRGLRTGSGGDVGEPRGDRVRSRSTGHPGTNSRSSAEPGRRLPADAPDRDGHGDAQARPRNSSRPYRRRSPVSSSATPIPALASPSTTRYRTPSSRRRRAPSSAPSTAYSDWGTSRTRPTPTGTATRSCRRSTYSKRIPTSSSTVAPSGAGPRSSRSPNDLDGASCRQSATGTCSRSTTTSPADGGRG